ncbi:MAG: Ig-like domain-containing protein, partial [Bacteroidia bacterium]
MRQTIFTLLMCITASLMHGNIIFTDISPDTVIQPPSNNTYDGRFSVDMNGNGQDDYRFVSTFGSSSRSARIILNMFNSTTGEYNEAIFLPGFNTDSVKPLAYNTNIAASSTGWVGRANFNPNIWEAAAPNFMGLGDKYIGVGFHIAGVIHYGWIHVNLDNNRVLTVRGFAYEDQPGVAILAGVGPVPATSVSVQGQGGVTTIPVLGNSLQMEATIMPANATVQQVAWSVTNGSGAATISPSGLLTAVSGGAGTV